MGGMDTKGRFHVHWGPAETFGERREESALRRSGRTVPDAAYARFDPVDTAALDEILERHDYDPKDLLAILEETQAEYGYLPVGALKHISRITGTWYAMIYGTATYYRHLRFEPPTIDARRPRARRTRRSSRPTGRRWRRRSASAERGDRRGGRRMSAFISTQRDFPSILTGRVAALEKDPGDLDAAVQGRRVRRACGSRSATSARPGRSPRSPPPGCAAGAARATRPARSGAPPRPSPAGQRYVVANGYGADPGSHTDAALLAADPYLVLEGLAIAAFAVGATEAILAVRADDPALVTKLEGAALAAEEAGFLGDNVLNSGQRVDGHDPTGPGRVHAGRGDGAAQGARGQARPARAEAAVSHRDGPVRQAHGRQQRPDAGHRPVDRPPGRRGVRGDRRRGQPGHGARPAPRPGGRRHRRGAVRDAAARRSSTSPAAAATARSRRS